MKIIKLGGGKGFAVGSHHFPTRSKARAFVRGDKLRIKRVKPWVCDVWEAPAMGIVGTFDLAAGLDLLRNVPGARIQRRG